MPLSSFDYNRIVRMDYGSDLFYAEFALEALSVWRRWNDDVIATARAPLLHEDGVLLATTRDLTKGGCHS